MHTVSRRDATALARGMFGYRLEIVSALWFLGQTEDCRIFENKSTRDIIQTILSEHGIRFAFRVGDTPPRQLIVQYNKTDLNFIMRLMEDEGWFYLFRHETASHTLVVTESKTSFNQVPDGTVILRPGSGRTTPSAWHQGRTTAHGKMTLSDYDPEKPATPLGAETSTTMGTAGAAQRDPFRWPARAFKRDQIQQRTRQRIEAEEAEAALAHGAGFNPGFFAGGRIQVIDQPDAKPRAFLLPRVIHEAADGIWCNDPAPPCYKNIFVGFPADLPWRPAHAFNSQWRRAEFLGILVRRQGGQRTGLPACRTRPEGGSRARRHP
ncbi:MAG TPA: contractile injection system protein, VgrG/Pvc8 family [Rhodopila sp.]|nr:contractile injection system protein, VgrG/Pvc8 family [Rhodopila sp.]